MRAQEAVRRVVAGEDLQEVLDNLLEISDRITMGKGGVLSSQVGERRFTKPQTQIGVRPKIIPRTPATPIRATSANQPQITQLRKSLFHPTLKASTGAKN